MRFSTVLLVALVPFGCGVVADNPFDPAAPVDRQARAQLIGTVVGGPEGTTPLTGAVVTLDGESAVAASPLATAGDGTFLFDNLAPGRWKLSVTHPQHRRRVVELVLLAGAVERPRIELEQIPVDDRVSQGRISGRVHRSGELSRPENERDHSGILVEVESTGIRTVTAADGSFDLFLQPGAYNVIFTTRHYNLARRNDVAVHAGETTELPDSPVVLDSNPGSVSGSVRLEGVGELGEHDDVSVTLLGGESNVTIADGSFVITGVAAGTHTLVASRPGWDSVTFPGVVVEGGRETTLPPLRLSLSRGTVTGRVRLAGRTDHFGVAVSITGTTLSAVSTPDGTFSIERVPVGSWELTARRDGFVRAVVGGVQVVADSATDAGTLSLAALQGDFDINGGSPFTRQREVTLALSAQNATTMRISEDPTFERGELGDTGFRDFEVAPAVTLSPGDGLKEVFVQLGLADGTRSGVLSGQIVLDMTPPESPSVTLDMGALYTRDLTGRVSLAIAAVDVTSGLASIQVSNDAVFDEPWVPYTPGLVHTLADAATDGERTVHVRFRDAAGNETPAAASATITLDRTPPALSRFAMACDGRSEAAFCRSSLVSLVLEAEGATRMLLSNQAGFPGNVQEPFAPARAWLLEPGDGSRTVHVQLIDEAGNRAEPGSATVVVDGTPPGSPFVRVESGAWTRSRSLTLQLGAVGADELRLDLLDVGGGRVEGAWEPYSTSRDVTLPEGPDGTYRIEATFRDMAANTSATVTANVTLDREAPVGGGVRVSTGSVTATQVVSLELSAFGASEMMIAVDGTLDTEPWETFSPVHNAVLPPGDGTKSIVVRFRDEAGNESVDATTQVVLDTGAPGGSIRLAGGATHTRSHVVAVTLANVDDDVVAMQVSEDAGFSGTHWQALLRSFDHALSPSDGPRTLFARFRDAAGNTGPAASASIVLDTEPPGSPHVSIVEGGHVSSPAITLGLGSVGASAMRIDVIDADGARVIGDWEPYATVRNLLLPSDDGVKRVEVTFRDEAGNESVTRVAQTILDTMPPASPSIAVRGAPIVSTHDVECVLSAVGAAEMRLAVDGVLDTEPWEPYATLRTSALPPGDGEKTIVAEFRDLALNVSETVTATVTVDATAPSGTLVLNGGAALTTTPTLSVTLEDVSTDVLSVRLSSSGAFTGSVWQPFLPSFSWTVVSGDGLKSVFAQFRDGAGNVSAPVSANITLDTRAPTSPTVSITQGLYVRTAGIDLALSAIGADEMRVDVIDADGSRTTGQWEGYATTKAVTLPTALQGIKRVEVSFRDLAGNVGELASAQTTYDTVAPTGAAIQVGSGDYATSNNLTATFAATGASQMVVAVDGTIDAEGWETFAGSKGLTLPGVDGEKTVAVKFRDEAGNETAVVTDAITLDTTRPSGTVTLNGGAARTNQRLVTLGFAGVSADVAEMQLSNEAAFTGATWQAYTPTLAWTLSTGDGSKTVYAKFRDAAGNVSVSSTSASITLDTLGPTSPTVSVSSGAYTNSANVTLTLSAVGADAMRVVVIDTDGGRTGGDWIAYATTHAITLPSATQGTKGVEVVFRDLAGNTSTIASAHTVFDTVAPSDASVSILGGEYTNDETLQLALNALGADEMRISADGAFDAEPWVAFSLTASVVLPPGDGLKTVRAVFRDRAGNVSSVASDAITLDQLQPSGAITLEGGAPRTASTVVQATFTRDSASTSQLMVSTDPAFAGASWQAFVSTLTVVLPSGDGSKTVYVRFRDGAGNESLSQSASIILDTTGPQGVSITVNAGAAWTNEPSVTLELSGGGDAVEMQLANRLDFAGGSGWVPFDPGVAWSLDVSVFGDGQRDIYAQFRDELGNLSRVAVATIGLDTTPPVVHAFDARDEEAFTASMEVSTLVFGSDALSGVEFMQVQVSPDGPAAAFIPYATEHDVVLFDAPPEASTRYTMELVLKDKAGNVSPVRERTIVYDATAPAMTSFSISPATQTASTGVTVSINAAEPAPGALHQMQLSESPTFEGTAWETFSPLRSFVLSSTNGTKTIYGRVKDRAGNVSAPLHASVVLDTQAPSIMSARVMAGAPPVDVDYVASPNVTLRVTTDDNVSIGSGLSYATSTTGTLDCVTAVYGVVPASACTVSPCVEDLPITLPSRNEPVTVHVCARDAVGNVSLRASDVVLYDQWVPPMVSGVTLKPFSRALEVRWPAVVDQGSGVENYEVQYSLSSGFSSAPTLTTTSTEVRIEELENRKPYYVRVRAVDRARRAGGWSSVANAVLGYSVGRSATAFADREPAEHSSVLVDGRLWVTYRHGTGFSARSCDAARADCRLAENWTLGPDMDPFSQDRLGSQPTVPIVAAFDRLWVGVSKAGQFGAFDSAGVFSCNYRQFDCHDPLNWSWTMVESKVTSPASTVHAGPVELHFTGSRLVLVYTRNTEYDGPRPVVATCSRELDCTDHYGWSRSLVQQPYPYSPPLLPDQPALYGVASTVERLWLVKRVNAVPRLSIATCLWASGCNEPADFTEYQVANALEGWPVLVRTGGRLYLAASGLDRKSTRLSRCDVATGCASPFDWTHGGETFSWDAIRLTFAAEGARRLHAAWHVDPHGQVFLASCDNPETTDCTSALGLNWPRFVVDQNVVLPTRPSLVVAGTQPLLTYIDHLRFFRFGGPRVMTPFDASFTGGEGSLNARWTSAPHVGGYEHVYRTSSVEGWRASVVDDPMSERSTAYLPMTPPPGDQQTALRSFVGDELGDESPVSTVRPFKWAMVATDPIESESCHGGLGTCARYAAAANDAQRFLLRTASTANTAAFSMCAGSSDCSSWAWPTVAVLAADGSLHEVAVAATNTHVYVAGRTGASNRVYVSRCTLSTGCSQPTHFSTPLPLFGGSPMTGVLQVEVSDTRAWVMATSTSGLSAVSTMLHSADPAQATSWTVPNLLAESAANGLLTGAVAPTGDGFSLYKATASGLMRTYRTSMNPGDPLRPWTTLLPASEAPTLRATVTPQGGVALTTVFDGRLWVGACHLSTVACAEPAAWSWVPLANWEPSLGAMVDIKNRNGVLYVTWANFDELTLATCRSDCGYRQSWSVAPVYRVGGSREAARSKPFFTVLSDDRLGYFVGGVGLLDGKALPPVK